MRPISDIGLTSSPRAKMSFNGCLGGLICILILTETTAQPATSSNKPIKRPQPSSQAQEFPNRANRVQLFMQDGLWWPKVLPEDELTSEQAAGLKPRRISRRSSSAGQEMPWWLPTANEQPVLGGDNINNNNHHHHHHLHNHHQHHSQGNFHPKEEQNYKTTTACDGSKAELNCEDGKSIHLVRAVFGRFSLNICNEYGYSNYSVACAVFRPFLDIATRCNNLTNCSVAVSKDLVEGPDPCPGTTKYLEVQYRCNDVNSQNSNNRQLPSNTNPVISTNPSAKQQQGPTAPPSSHKSHSSVNHNNVVGGSSSPLPMAATTTKTLDDPNGNNNNDGVGPGQSGGLQATSSYVDSNNLAGQQPQLQNTVIQQQYCLPQTSSRNLFWNYTRAGQVAHQPCPEGSSGQPVSWLCDYERLRFMPALSPDFSQCRSNWLTRLSQELDKMLEVPPVRQQISLSARQQDEQMIKSILGELNLLAKTKELFSEDLKRIDIMISQMIAQLRSFSVLSGGNQASSMPLAAWSTRATSAGQPQSPLVSIYSELFAELASICSSLFDSFQRNAWLELPTAESRHRLEMRLLSHLKEAGLMFAQSLTLDQLAGMQPIRQPNVVAGISVIINNQLKTLANTSGSSDKGANELNLFGRLFDGNNAPLLSSADDGDTEFRLQPQLLNELEANGITKFLVLDIKKLDYSLMRLHLEQQVAVALEQQRLQQQHLAQTISPDISQSLALDQTQFQKRIFGVFAINGETGELFDAASAATTLNGKQHDSIRKRLSELLAQWSLGIDFKMSPSASQATTGAIVNQQQPTHQCQSLSSDTFNMATDDGQPNMANSLTNRCHLAKYNATNFICSCDRFGFVALTQQFMASSQVFGPNGFPSIQNDHVQWPSPINDLSFGRTHMIGGDQQLIDSRAYDPSYVVNRPQQQSFGPVTYIFVVVGVALLILAVAGLAINLTFRLTGHSRLGKKKQSFFESLRDGPTTGPLAANHNLMGSDPLVSGAATTQSASIIGLASGSATGGPTGQICANSTATSGSNYKAHHQLYSAHMGAHSPPILDVYSPSDARRWPARLAGWLMQRPSTWLSNLTSSNGSNANKTDRMIQHRIVGSNTSTIGTLAHHKSQYQNGYTTSPGMHNPVQHHQTIGRAHFGSNGGGSQSAMPLNPSSNSSYVSSSAYYEEIGPGNLTKVNSNQISGMSQSGVSNQHTIVDPFMMKQRHYLDAQNHHQHHQHTLPNGQGIQQQQAQQHHHQQQVFHQWQSPATSNAATISFSPPIGQQQQQPMSLITKQHLHNDLSPLQSSSSSSAGSQHSASAVPTNMTNGMPNGSNGTTPRHFLFASPIAVNAYKQQQQQFRGHHHHDQLDR